jgi:hypothetical protein
MFAQASNTYICYLRGAWFGGQGTNCPYLGFLSFCESFQASTGIVSQIKPQLRSFIYFFTSLFPNIPSIQQYEVWVRDSNIK